MSYIFLLYAQFNPQDLHRAIHPRPPLCKFVVNLHLRLKKSPRLPQRGRYFPKILLAWIQHQSPGALPVAIGTTAQIYLFLLLISTRPNWLMRSIIYFVELVTLWAVLGPILRHRTEYKLWWIAWTPWKLWTIRLHQIPKPFPKFVVTFSFFALLSYYACSMF